MPATNAATTAGTSWGWVGTALQLLWVLFLFALVLFLAYFTTRVVGRRFGGGSGRYLRVIESVPMGQNRAMSLVEVSGEIYCVGVTEHGITLLGKLDRGSLVELEPLSDSPVAAPANPFAGALTGFSGVAQDAFGRIAGRFRSQTPDQAEPAAPAQASAGEGEFANRIREQIERLREIGEREQK